MLFPINFQYYISQRKVIKKNTNKSEFEYSELVSVNYLEFIIIILSHNIDLDIVNPNIIIISKNIIADS